MDKEDLKQRTKHFALQIIDLVSKLPRSRTSDVIARQVLRSATSIGANYRSACRARSKADFIYKIGIVEEETDETQYWLELIVEAGLLPPERISSLLQEADELIAIFTASGKTAKSRKSKIPNPKS